MEEDVTWRLTNKVTTRKEQEINEVIQYPQLHKTLRQSFISKQKCEFWKKNTKENSSLTIKKKARKTEDVSPR